MVEIIETEINRKLGIIKDGDDRRLNPITYELTGEWSDGLYVFDDIVKITSNKINFIIIVKNNKVVTVYKNK
jgi:hypothetical protein